MQAGVILLLLILHVVVIATTTEASVCQTVVSGDSVQTIDSRFTGVSPKPTNCGLGDCSLYLSTMGCLSVNGPLGAYGPLGALGPLGSNTWSAAYWFNAVGDWSEYSKKYTGMGGPLSKDGPLGSKGPLGDSYYSVMPHINDFAMHMQGNGIWSVLGPIGPLGALGPLGPLGPIGAHGYHKLAGGDWSDPKGHIVRKVTVDYDGSSSRTFGLFEMYTTERAIQMGWDQDTSFMVAGEVSPTGTDTFPLASSEPQWVTVVVVPQYYYDNFDLEILDANGRSIVSSSGTATINWAQLYVPSASQRLQIRVKLGASAGQYLWDHHYFLYVVGSTQYVRKDINFQGKYIHSC